jgi:hypothetical protein
LHLLPEPARRILHPFDPFLTVGTGIMNELNTSANGFPKFLRDIRFTFEALAAGSRVVPMADNRWLITDLAARAGSIYGKAPRRVG